MALYIITGNKALKALNALIPECFPVSYTGKKTTENIRKKAIVITIAGNIQILEKLFSGSENNFSNTCIISKNMVLIQINHIRTIQYLECAGMIKQLTRLCICNNPE